MSWVRVQQKDNGLEAVAIRNSVTVTFDATPVQGNLLVAFGIDPAGAFAPAVAGYTQVLDPVFVVGDPNVGCWYKIAGAAEPTAVTLKNSGANTSELGLWIAEYSGGDPANPIDVFAQTAQTTNGPVTGFPGFPGYQGDLSIACMCQRVATNFAASYATFFAGAGYPNPNVHDYLGPIGTDGWGQSVGGSPASAIKAWTIELNPAAGYERTAEAHLGAAASGGSIACAGGVVSFRRAGATPATTQTPAGVPSGWGFVRSAGSAFGANPQATFAAIPAANDLLIAVGFGQGSLANMIGVSGGFAFVGGIDRNVLGQPIANNQPAYSMAVYTKLASGLAADQGPFTLTDADTSVLCLLDYNTGGKNDLVIPPAFDWHVTGAANLTPVRSVNSRMDATLLGLDKVEVIVILASNVGAAAANDSGFTARVIGATGFFTVFDRFSTGPGRVGAGITETATPVPAEWESVAFALGVIRPSGNKGRRRPYPPVKYPPPGTPAGSAP